eukprot:1192073-Prorocentrum_minimum.AAC.1
MALSLLTESLACRLLAASPRIQQRLYTMQYNIAVAVVHSPPLGYESSPAAVHLPPFGCETSIPLRRAGAAWGIRGGRGGQHWPLHALCAGGARSRPAARARHRAAAADLQSLGVERRHARLRRRSSAGSPPQVELVNAGLVGMSAPSSRRDGELQQDREVASGSSVVTTPLDDQRAAARTTTTSTRQFTFYPNMPGNSTLHPEEKRALQVTMGAALPPPPRLLA